MKGRGYTRRESSRTRLQRQETVARRRPVVRKKKNPGASFKFERGQKLRSKSRTDTGRSKRVVVGTDEGNVHWAKGGDLKSRGCCNQSWEARRESPTGRIRRNECYRKWC